MEGVTQYSDFFRSLATSPVNGELPGSWKKNSRPLSFGPSLLNSLSHITVVEKGELCSTPFLLIRSATMFFPILVAVVAAVAGVTAQASLIPRQAPSVCASALREPDVVACFGNFSVPLDDAASSSGVLDGLDNWLNGFCQQRSCSADTLTSATGIFLFGCWPEVEPLSGSISSEEQAKSLLRKHYETLRSGACSKDSNESKTFCLRQVLADIFESERVKNLPEFVAKYNLSYLKCTNCFKSVWDAWRPLFSDVWGSLISSVVETIRAKRCKV